MKNIKYPDLKSGITVDSKIRDNQVLGRAWAKQSKTSLRAYNVVGEYNYNNILFHLKNFSKNQNIELEQSGTFNFSRFAEKVVLSQLAKHLKLSFNSLSGYITGGGTESNIYALWIARNWAMKNSKKAHWIIPEVSHYSFNKAVDVLGLSSNNKHIFHFIKKNEKCSTSASDVIAQIDSIKKYDKIVPIILVLTAMTTEFGLIDPIKEVASYIKAKKLKNIFIHVDACYSGFILPFVRGYKKIFSFPEITSISVDFHKTYGGPIGSGAILLNGDLFKFAKVHSPYLSDHSDYTLSGSRSGLHAIQLYELWKEKKSTLSKEVAKALEKTLYLYEKLQKIKGIFVLYKPFANYIIFETDLIENKKYQDFVDICNNYSVSASKVMEKNGERHYYKLIINHYIPMKVLNSFTKDLEKCIKTITTK